MGRVSDELRCTWRGSGQPRGIIGRHVSDCTGECRGCEPCPERHCICCGHNHSLDQTCPSCLAEVRTDIGLIEFMLRVRLRAQVTDGSSLTGSGSVKLMASSDIPGGEAMVEIGPYSDGGAATDRLQKDDERVRPEATISQIMGSWSQDWTESAGGTVRHPSNHDHVTWAAKHHPAFDDFAREIREHRSRLEDMLHDGERADLGAPCFVCHRPLERHYGKSEGNDSWWCEKCKKDLGVAEYVEEVGKNYRRNAEWLTAEDVSETYQIPRGSLSSWASGGDVRKKRDMNTGRMVYNVKDALTRRDGMSA